MNELTTHFSAAVESDSLIQLVLSQPIRDSREHADAVEKIVIRPVDLKSGRNLQFTFCEARRETHRNLSPTEAVSEIERLLTDQFRRGHLFTADFDFTVKVKASGKVRAQIGRAHV